MKVIVLGAGLVGAPMAVDLAKDGEFDVAVADINASNLAKLNDIPGISLLKSDLSDSEVVKALVKEFDFVVSAVPGFMGFNTLKAIIEAGKNVVDIAFFPEDPFPLDELAKEQNITAITDCGVAPGMSYILTGYAHEMLDETHNSLTYVGGLPLIRKWPWEYRAVFSPADVIEEYTRPARYIENGRLIVRPALSDPEMIDFEGVGTLEAFNSDGIRSLAKTINALNIKEKTLRYPGHIEKIKVLRETGFFDKEPIEINGMLISPLDFTSEILFPKWKMEEGEEDITIMRVIVEGVKNEEKLRYTWSLFDRYDAVTKIHSMARTTGYTATVVLRMLALGLYKRKGLIVPEYIGKNEDCVKFILKGLAERGVVYKENIEKI